MKTFLNVLYRRILYKIPLKLLLVLLAVFGVLFACFSSAIELPGRASTWTFGPNESSSFSTVLGDSVCFSSSSNSSCNSITITAGELEVTGNPYQQLVCALMFGDSIPSFKNNTSNSCTMYYFRFNADDINPPYTSLECQTEYNLIPISSVDQSYCISNNLCPSCPSCPVGGSGFSQLYINNILHLGAPNIIMNIPDEIDWDYAYTQGGQNMNIDVVGYNVDYEKIDSVVQLQNYKPTDEDFSEIISVLAPYSKIIIFFVVLFSLWAMIKKPFKSKKL